MRGKRILQLILLLALTIPIQVSAQAIDPSEKGEWSEIIPMPIVSVAAANLPNGKILTWSAFDRFRFGGRNGKTYTVIFDPETQQSEEFLISDTQHDMFCPGTANLTDGRIMVTGGSGPPKTSIYDPFENKWTSGEDMNIPRGYHAMVTLSDGNVFTIGGSWSGGRGNKHSEVWDRKTGKWSKKSGIPVAAMGNSSDYHAWLWQAPNGKLFHAGPTKEMHWIDYSTANGSYESAGSRAADDHAFSGAIVMYDKGKLLKIGGATTFSGGQVANGITTIMDINKDKVQLKQVGSLNTPRALHNATVLPTGEVFISGGLATAKYFSDTGARLTPELWNPKTEKWTAVAPMQVPRNYHSSAILLPDGRVMLSGGGLCGGCKVNHPDAEIYSPPYLFNSQGKLATRPVIKSAPDKAPQGSVITLNTDKAISYFSIVRFSSNTHSTNNEQRRIELPATRVGKNQYQVSIPTPNVAVPGYYMLFAIDGNGVPSVSKSIMLDPEAPAQNKCVIEGVALEYNLNLSGWRQMAGTTFTVKVGDRLNISANPNGQASYVWNGPAGFRKTGNKNGDILLANKVTANMGGKYEVTLRYNNGCVKKKAFTLQVITPPTNFFAHWKLDNNARDAIGNAHGALKAGAKLVNDAERGKVLSVEGEGQYMLVNPKPQLQVGTGGQDFTVAFWMNLKQSHTGKWRSVIHKGLNSRDRTFAMWMRPKDNKIHFRISTTQSWNEGANSKASIPLNTWTHIAYVHEGKKLKLYINGELDQTVNLRGVSLSNNAKLYLGDSPWSQTAKSRMDDVRLYGYALSADDIAGLIPGCEASGLISASYWYEVSGGSVGDIPLNRQPDDRELLTLFETPTNVRDNYAARVSGYICPPTTGDYTFWIASDDNGELYISPDEKPENKELIAFVPGWTNARKYDKYDAQRSSKLRLVKGKKYYVEALMNEGGGGDNLSVAWTLPNGKLEGPISGAYLAPFMEEEKLTQTITFQPVGDKPKTADNFQLTATSSSKLAVSFSVVSGPASIDGNKVSLTGGKGVVRIKAFQAGNAVFESAEVFQEFNVVEEINDDCQGEGTITLDTWKNIPGRLISDIPLNTPPTTSKDISLFEIAPDTDDQYGSRIRGYVV
ncbi:MAG: LamG-like jellyroll fold domain-containing protein, partial [Bacteroidota bacterium]